MSDTSSPNVSNSDLEMLSDLLRTSSPNHKSPPVVQSLNIAKAQITTTQEESTTITPEDKLIELQTRKIELLEKRDLLVKVRSNLYNEVNELRVTLHDLNKQITTASDQQDMKQLLDSNTKAYIQDLELKNLKNDDYLLNNLNVLPSTDWDLRLEYIKKFVPFLEVDKINTYNEYSSNMNQMIRIIEFQLILPLIFKVDFKLFINCDNDTLMKIETLDLFKISMISSSFSQTLTRNYIPLKKINNIMYGLNSFSKLLHTRILIMHRIIKEFKDNLYDTEKYQDLISENTVPDNKKTFAILQATDQMELKFEVQEKQYQLVLNWGIVTGDATIGSCQSLIELYLIDHKDIHTNTSNLSQIYQSLLDQYDVITSLKIIIKNIF